VAARRGSAETGCSTGGKTTELWAALQMVLMLLEKVEYRL
jgi:hypothetical protein